MIRTSFARFFSVGADKRARRAAPSRPATGTPLMQDLEARPAAEPDWHGQWKLLRHL